MKHYGAQQLDVLAERYPGLSGCLPDVAVAIETLIESYAAGHKTLICGNGGSAADADHMVAELMKSFHQPRAVPHSFSVRLNKLYDGNTAQYLSAHLQGALPAINLASHTAFLTAYANDVAADMVFAQQVYGYGKKGDTLFCLSTSGASQNVIYAAQVAKAMGMDVLSMTGADESALQSLSDVNIALPSQAIHHIQEMGVAVYHTICLALEDFFFGNKE